MQNDAPELPSQSPAMQPQPAVYVSPPAIAAVKTPPSASQSILEFMLLGVGIVTVSSFLLNNGFILKLGLIVVMLVAFYYMLQGFSHTKKNYNIDTSNPAAQAQPKNGTSVVKMLGITLLIIILLPVFGIAAMIALLILVLMLGGGGNMGT